MISLQVFHTVFRPLGIFLFFLGLIFSPHLQASKVEVVTHADGSFQLLKDGEPYYIKGAGGTVELENWPPTVEIPFVRGELMIILMRYWTKR